jgi:Spy/CpxP family protein refolding chaperone
MKVALKGSLVVLAVILLLGAQFAHGFAKEGILSLTGWWERQSIVRAVGLTYEQVSRIQEIYNQNHTKTRELRVELKKQSMEISNLFEQDILDDAKISEKAEKIATIHSAIDKADIMLRVAAIKELSAEQRKKLRALASK